MKKHLLWAVILSIAFLSPLSAAPDWRETYVQWYLQEQAEQAGVGETSADAEQMSADLEQAMELLEHLAESPIDINHADRQELEQLPFLTAAQVEQIVEHVYRYGGMRSLGELRLLPALTPDCRELLVRFVYIGERQPRRNSLRLDSIVRHGRHSVLFTGRVPCYTRRGDDNGYAGYPYRHSLRYQLTYRQRLRLGVTAAQDAGEPFFSGVNRWGYDHYSYYMQLRGSGVMENLCLGMYDVQLGMGLLVNSSFSLGKTAMLQNMGRASNALRPHSSRSSASYMQGIAATLRLSPSWHLTAFGSYRPVDATLNSDQTVRTLLSSGYHRTTAELQKKHNTHIWDGGLSGGYRRGSLYANVNAVFTHLDRQIRPDKRQSYRRYYPEGNDFFNASLDYGYATWRFSFAGETAINKSGALAAIHSASLQLGEGLSAMLLHRYYSRRYTSLHANSFSEGGHVQNEHGVYGGLSWQVSRSLSLQWYADYAHFPYLRYQVSGSSDAFDTALSALCKWGEWRVDGRYRMHIRQRDNADHTRIVNRTEHRLRLRARRSLGSSLGVQAQADGILVNYLTTHRGGMFTLQGDGSCRWFTAVARIGYFRTDDYESRIYQYERGLQYSFGFPMYYGHGLRYSILLQSAPSRRIKIAAKIGTTTYFDRSKVGSSLQQVDHSSLTDVDLQLHYVL